MKNACKAVSEQQQTENLMSDEIKHECGVALLRLRKDIPYYQQKYGTCFYGYHKLSLLLEKQHNRGQDGAGIAALGLNVEPGNPYYQLEKSNCELSLADLLERIGRQIQDAIDRRPVPEKITASLEYPFCSELYLGHLRYGTFGRRALSACHPFVRESSCRRHTLLLAGNFNLTNTEAIFRELVNSGHHPCGRQDSQLLLLQLCHYLEKQLAGQSDENASPDIFQILRETAPRWDGGYTICGMLGNGDAFALRDAAGIRPGYYYVDDEIAVVASERPAIQTAFNLTTEQVRELPPGHALTISRQGEVRLERILPEVPPKRCVFERIYFSRGNDADIHNERIRLGRLLTPSILKAVDNDLENTVFSYIPNTAQLSFHGLLEELDDRCGARHVRFSQIAVKDAKFRTFITDAAQRKDLFPHVYDVTYGVIRTGQDNLVVLDDSIVRGNTMRNAILPILDRLGPKKIVVASAAPPICYPDCYGIDMATFGELVAFEALVSLLHKHGEENLLHQAAELARQDLKKPDREMLNRVQPLYRNFSFEELCREIGLLLKPAHLNAELEVVFQTVDNVHTACPEHRGDWYFTGDYPTLGGNRVVNRALVNFVDGIQARAY